jgi:hypothetical protein
MGSGADDDALDDRLDSSGKRHGGKKPASALRHPTLAGE